MDKKQHYKGYSIRKRGNSFQIRITFKGQTYNSTYNPPTELSESKQYAAAEKEAQKLKEKVMLGFSSAMPTFEAFATAYLEDKALSVRKSTLYSYENMLPRLIDEFGSMRLDQITPHRLNQFYQKLQNTPLNRESSAVIIPQKLDNYLKQEKIKRIELERRSGVSNSTLYDAMHGKKISYSTAEKICSALSLNVNDYFYIIENTKKLSGRTISDYITQLRSIFNEAVKQRILDYNPVNSSNIPRFDKKTVNYYQPDEIKEIWQALEKEPLRWQVIISLLIVTGCRRSEIAGLRWEQILWDYNLLCINHEALYNSSAGLYTEDFTKNVDEKYVQIDEATMELLREYRRQLVSDMEHLGLSEADYPKYCFYKYKNIEEPIQPDTINSHLRSFSTKNGFRNINPHSLRHSLASALIADGIDDYAVSRQLGHKQVSTTKAMYTHQINEHQAKVAARIPQIYNLNSEKTDTE